ncbi:MAG: type IX secretion system sortase PorU [Prevotella sp.]|nr:type IX secretion system sortase PorU [Prevotella sp.]
MLFSLFTLFPLSLFSAGAQRFYNLTTGEVKIDSLLPYFRCSVPLTGQYRDSLYTPELLYPEFIDMTSTDVERYLSITDQPLASMPSIDHQISIDRGKGILELGFCPLVFREGKYQILVSFMLKVTAKPKRRSLRVANARVEAGKASRYAAHSVLSEGKWAKIRVPSSGIYQLSADVVSRAGFSNINQVKIYGYGGALQPETLTEEYLVSHDDLKEVPTCEIGGRRVFYAQGPVSWSSETATVRTRNPYSDYGYYFITQSDGEPLKVDSATLMASAYPNADDYHVLREVDNYAWFQGGRNLFENDPISAGNSKTYKVETPASMSGGKLAVAVSAGTNSSVQVEANGKTLGTINIKLSNYDKGNSASGTYRLDSLVDVNNVKITTVSGGPVRLDYITFVLSQPKDAPDLMTAALPEPEYVHNITNQDLHAHEACDMVIIIPTSQKLLTQAERLAEHHRQRDGLRVRIVPSDEIINEFSSGTPDATAYRRYMKMLYDRAETEADMPRYLLLFGDCVWDNRMNTSNLRNASPDDYLLCFESENSFNQVHCIVSDDFFTILDDGEVLLDGYNARSKSDVAVGRFPVVNDADAKLLVDKVINYATNRNVGPWQNTLVFMGDDGNSNMHMKTANEAADLVSKAHPGYIIKKVMWDAYQRETSSTGNAYPEVEKLIKQYQTSGALVMNYCGHGRADQISHEAVLRLLDFEQFSNANLPLWITASCDIMPFDGLEPTIGEAAILNTNGGAVAFFGTTRTVYAQQNDSIDKAFLRYVLSTVDGKPMTLGEAQRQAKNYLVTPQVTPRGSVVYGDLSDNKLQYSLLGDPALALNVPVHQVVIDSINGQVVGTGDMPVLKAGSIATVKGHVEGLPDFRGIVSATVRDTEETIVCRLNDKSSDGASRAFEYNDRTKTIYTGNDSISQGVFELKFAVPLDINYKDGKGLVNIFARSNDRTLTAHGASDNFIVGGSEENKNDGVGPSIYCYLNSPSFINGGSVNSTPFFVAELSDADGINASGSGIGHDMELIIDGEMMRTYNLNYNFQYDFGSYTAGTTYYSIPELPAGPHKLLFRAWDVLNNSSTTELAFNVVSGLSPSLIDINCTKNPARTSTTFVIKHDRAGSAIDVDLEIFDMSGRMLWKYAESGTSATSTYTIDWDLTVDDGRRLPTGVYLYRVRISSDGSSKVSKAKKLVIL